MLGQCAKLFGKPFSQVSKDDIVIKRFFKWLRKSEDYPEEVRWIGQGSETIRCFQRGLLTDEEEVKKMAEIANNPRDRALILVLYEPGCRIGEILSLKIKNVQF